MSGDFPVMMNNSNHAMNMASNPAGYLQDDAARSFAKKYSESLRYAGVGGTDIPYQEQLTRAVDYDQGPVMGEKLIAGPSFSIAPDIDSPVVDKMLQDLRGTPGYQAPGPLSPYVEDRARQLRKYFRGIVLKRV
jgi:hypothetical protein